MTHLIAPASPEFDMSQDWTRLLARRTARMEVLRELGASEAMIDLESQGIQEARRALGLQ